jgi:3-(3-hydroxy-phenyl)propionate hydroxylase
LRSRGLPFKAVPLSAHLHPRTQGVHAWDHTGRIFERYDARPGAVYVLRPDGHVLGRWRDAQPGDIDAAIARALCASTD